MHNSSRGESSKKTTASSTSRVSRRGDDDKKQKHDISYLLNQGRGHRPDDKAGASRDQKEGRSGSSSASSLTQAELKRWCSICKKLFAQPADLKKHHKCVHLKERPFQCDHCPAAFGEKGNLNRHKKSVHEKERPWTCPQCGLQFAFRDTLTRHVNAVHDGIRPYKCDECLSSFKKRGGFYEDAEVKCVEKTIEDTDEESFVDANDGEDHLHRHQEALHPKKRK